MNLLDEAAAKVDVADLVILRIVETIRDQIQPATASAVASFIGGASKSNMWNRMTKLRQLGLLDYHVSPGVQLTPMGAELLARELVGWSPSKREQARRDSELRSAIAGAVVPKG